MAANSCDFIDQCPMFHYFHSTAKQIYLDVYCRGDYTLCKRRALLMSGERVPKNLLPHGGSMQDSEKTGV